MAASIASMTGYARASGDAAGTSFHCELKSVNGRGLDLRLRLPPGFDELELELRRRLGQRLARGSVSFTLEVDRIGAGVEIMVNTEALDVVVAALGALAPRLAAEPPRLDGILALNGVLVERRRQASPEAEAALHAAILAAADTCLARLLEARQAEGAHLNAIITGHLATIEQLTQVAEAHPSRRREAILARLRAGIEALGETGATLSEERLAQEAMLLAAKADIREELDRLVAHIAAARALLAAGGPIGRKLDFLSQELNREANTLCSKANAVELTAIGLDLKAAIDQVREQLQNIE